MERKTSVGCGYYVVVLSLLMFFRATTVRSDSSDQSHYAGNKKTAIFAFGDSIYDPGNNNYIASPSGYRANFKPYGESYFKSPTGRFSDGRLIPDFIAEFADLPMIPTYYEALHNHSTYGVNFASAGAGNLDETHFGKAISLNTQLSNFKNVSERWKTQLGKTDSDALLSNAVYLFSTANNDYLRLFDIPDTPSDISCLAYTTEEEYVNMVIDSFLTIVKEIYMLGGRKFGIQSVLPLGCLPRFRALAFYQAGLRDDCLDALNSLAKKHNLALLQKLKELKKELKGFEYSYFSIFDALNELFENPSVYGFKEAKKGCCGLGPYRGFGICGVENAYELCENVKDHIIFDSYHPTEKASYHFAKIWWQGAQNVVESQSLKSLFLQHEKLI